MKEEQRQGPCHHQKERTQVQLQVLGEERAEQSCFESVQNLQKDHDQELVQNLERDQRDALVPEMGEWKGQDLLSTEEEGKT